MNDSDFSGDSLRERDDAGFHEVLVTARRVEIAELVVRRDRAAAAAHRNERAVAALFPGGHGLEPRGSLTHAAIDMPDRLRGVAGESGTGVQRSIRADRVRVAMLDFARSQMDAIVGPKPVLFRLVAQERHLVVEEVAGLARALLTARTSSRGRHARS